VACVNQQLSSDACVVREVDTAQRLPQACTLKIASAAVAAFPKFPAVSLVNLAMALAIAVEFCAHILHSFCRKLAN
jgi:hypothetical protein